MISKDEYYLEIAKLVGKRSTCLHHQVGCILVRDDQILSTGYNGSPRKTKHCIDIGCNRDHIPSGTMHEKCRAVHAEQNAIIQAALHGVSTKNSIAYVNIQPCVLCAKMLINAGVCKVIYHSSYPETNGLEMLQEANVEYIQM